jgi:uncharacterized membrane protein
MQHLHEHIDKDGFRHRGVAFSRIDAFSDVVFGFALTLLVVSLEVPHTFEELNRSLRGFIPFAICFLLLILLWYSHFKFFRRYGLHDNGTIVINAALLFVVLFYVYPLKFLFTVLTNAWVGQDNSAFGTSGQMRELMLLYGVGFVAVYLLFTALHWNALRQRDELQLTPIEIFLTRSSMVEYTLMAAVGLLSILVALFARRQYVGIAGFVYMSLWFIGMGHGRWERRKLQRLQKLHPHQASDQALNN